MSENSLSLPKIPEFHPWHARVEQAIRALLLIFITSLPFHQLLFVERHGFLVLLGFLVIWIIINRQVWVIRTPLDVPLLTFICWVGVTIPFASFPEYSLKEFGKLIQGGLIFYAVVFFLNGERQRHALLVVLVGLVAVVSAAGIYQFDPRNYQATQSFFSSEVWLTTFLVMFLPLCWALAVFDRSRLTRPLFLTVGILATVCLLLTQSRAGLLALMVEAWIFAWLYRNHLFRIIIGTLTGLALIVLTGVIYVDQTPNEDSLVKLRRAIPFRTYKPSIEHRLNIWTFALSEIGKHPLVGIGYGSETLSFLYPHDVERVRNVGTHNIFLYLALHVGIPGLLLFIWLIVVALHELTRSYLSATQFPSKAILLGGVTGVSGLLVRIQFDQMLVGTLAILFWVLIALAMIHFMSLRGKCTMTPLVSLS